MPFTASDGVWEFITSGEAVDIVQKSLASGADCDAGTTIIFFFNLIKSHPALSNLVFLIQFDPIFSL